MVLRMSRQCIYIQSNVLSSVPYYAIILRKYKKSIVSRVRLPNYLFRIRRSGVNINNILHPYGFKQNNMYIFLSQIRRSLRTLTTLRGLRYGCLLTQGLELCPHSSLRMLKVFNGSHDLSALTMTSLTQEFYALRMHGYVICTWFDRWFSPTLVSISVTTFFLECIEEVTTNRGINTLKRKITSLPSGVAKNVRGS